MKRDWASNQRIRMIKKNKKQKMNQISNIFMHKRNVLKQKKKIQEKVIIRNEKKTEEDISCDLCVTFFLYVFFIYFYVKGKF